MYIYEHSCFLPQEEHVCKCLGLESVYVTSHLSYIISSLKMVQRPDEDQLHVRKFWFLCLATFALQCR